MSNPKYTILSVTVISCFVSLLRAVSCSLSFSLYFSSAQLEGLLADVQSRVQMSMCFFFPVPSLRVCWHMFRAVFRCLCVFFECQVEGLLADVQSLVQMSCSDVYVCFSSAQLEGLLADVQSLVQMSCSDVYVCFSSAQLEGLLADVQSCVQMSMCFCGAQLEGLLADV